jgi:hypothetical protein
MPSQAALAQRLKTLREREGLSVAALSARSGLAESAIYKAEGGVRDISWRTVHVGYDEPFCRTPQESAELLMLWALAHTRRPPGSPPAVAWLHGIAARDGQTCTPAMEAVMREMEQMPLAQQTALADFARAFRTRPAARKIAAVLAEEERER